MYVYITVVTTDDSLPFLGELSSSGPRQLFLTKDLHWDERSDALLFLDNDSWSADTSDSSEEI